MHSPLLRFGAWAKASIEGVADKYGQWTSSVKQNKFDGVCEIESHPIFLISYKVQPNS